MLRPRKMRLGTVVAHTSIQARSSQRVISATPLLAVTDED
jgi:hypothetical protein